MSLQVAREIARRGHHVVLVYREEGDAFQHYDDFVAARYKLKLGPLGLRDPISSINLMFDLWRLVKEQRIDLCFSTNLGLARTTGSLQLLKVPAVYHFGLMFESGQHIDALTRWGIRRISAGIAPSINAAQSWKLGNLAPPIMAVCPNWADTERFRRLDNPLRLEKRKALGLAPDRPLVAYIGRLSPEKGVPTLLRAAQILSEQGTKCSMVLVGDLDARYRNEFMSAIAKLKSADFPIHVVSQVNHPEEYLSVADVAVVPGEGPETFGLTLIEAMASELPTIASRANNFPEIIGTQNEDLLFAPACAPECAALLRKWLDVDERCRLERGRQLRARVLRDYSSANASCYEDIFFQAVESNRRTDRGSGAY